MNIRTTALTALLSLAPLCVQSASAATLTLKLNGFRESTGHLLLMVHNNAEGWDGKGRAAAMRRVPVTDKELVLEIPELGAGQYAITLFHDVNDNGQLDMNAMGMPLEGYGFSNNVGARGRPQFDDARFDLPAEGRTLEIRVN